MLIANRGEIAVRVIRACREMGLSPVAVYSECDRTAPHVRYADEAYPIGPSAPLDSYLRIDRIVDAARRAGADAVHPGYGFLSENESFARAVRDAGLTFIGPSPEVVALMGSKTAARAAAQRAGVAVVPGTDAGAIAADATDEDVRKRAEPVGYPLLVKAVSGGGGKGMRTVTGPADLAGAVRAARSEAGTAFGDAAVYFERQMVRPRHVEIQVLGDQHGTVLPFVERECSIQRRHQKVVEETPSPAVSPALRQALTAAAAAVMRSVGYSSAGTVEFLLNEDGSFYFLEVNTRLQVEHAITEMVTGLDLVHWQIRIARGERLNVPAIDPDRLLVPHGHSIECRIYAEDPGQPVPPLTRADSRPARAGGTGRARRQRHRDGFRRADVLRPDAVETGRVGRGSCRGHRAAAPRARRVPRRTASGRPSRSSGGCSISRRSRRAGFTRPTWMRRCRRGTASRSSKRRRTRRRSPPSRRPSIPS